MKKIVGVCLMVLILLTSLVFVGCGGENAADTLSVNYDGFVLLPTRVGVLPSDGETEIGFRFDNWRFSITEEGEPVVVITYSIFNGRDVAITNVRDQEATYYNLRMEVNQITAGEMGGVRQRLESYTGTLYGDDPFYLEVFEIAPGGTREGIESAFMVRNWMRDIEVNVSGHPHQNRYGRMYSFYIPLGGRDALTPVPAGDFEENVVGNHIEITGVRLGRDNEGNDVAIVTYNFANLSEYGGMPLLINMRAYQNDIRLGTVHQVHMPQLEQTAAMVNLLRSVPTGYMFEVEKIFILNDLETDLVISMGRVIDLLAPLDGMVAQPLLYTTLSLPH